MIGVVSDMHLKDTLGYAAYVPDERKQEKRDVLDAVVDAFSDCHSVVMLGDMLNGKNNSSQVVAEFVQFLERFEDKDVYVICGNHEKRADGTTALDFLLEIKDKPNWHIILHDVERHRLGKIMCSMSPYFHKSELGVMSRDEGTDLVMEKLSEPSDILFVHHALTDTVAENGYPVSKFREVVLHRTTLEKRFRLVVGGHIHHPQVNGRTVVVGSTIANEMDECQRYVLKIDDDTLAMEQVPLPGIRLLRLYDPAQLTLERVKQKGNTIVKVVMTDRNHSEANLPGVLKASEEFLGSIFVEQFPKERRKIDTGGKDALEFSPEELLELYAKERGVKLEKLKNGWRIVCES